MENSPLSKLPAELRIKIYEYAQAFERVSCKPRGLHRWWPGRSMTSQLALTRVCRQMRLESLHLLFTRNDPVVGLVPCAREWPSLNVLDLYERVDETVRTIESIPPTLMSTSTMFSLDLNGRAEAMILLKARIPEFEKSWAFLEIFLGRLMYITKPRRFMLDFTPYVGNRTYGARVQCDVSDIRLDEASPVFRYDLEHKLVMYNAGAGERLPLATFDHAPILSAMREHETHDQSACNFNRQGKRLIARAAKLEQSVGTILGGLFDACRGTQIWEQMVIKNYFCKIQEGSE